MARHLKSIIKNRLKGIVSYYAPHSDISASHARGVCYFVPVECIKYLWGKMNTFKEGAHYKKHIVVRHYPRRGGVLQLYTYHFPKTWSAACVANRELIKLAQRQAHAMEHANTPEALEWKIRFFNHYFTVVKGGAKPEPGLKPYSRFYQYTYVAIYRQLKEQQRQTTSTAQQLQTASNDSQQPQTTSNILLQPQTISPISFDQIELDPLQSFRTRRSPLRSAARRAFLSSSFDEDFILKPRACFSG